MAAAEEMDRPEPLPLVGALPTPRPSAGRCPTALAAGEPVGIGGRSAATSRSSSRDRRRRTARQRDRPPRRRPASPAPTAGGRSVIDIPLDSDPAPSVRRRRGATGVVGDVDCRTVRRRRSAPRRRADDDEPVGVGGPRCSHRGRARRWSPVGGACVAPVRDAVRRGAQRRRRSSCRPRRDRGSGARLDGHAPIADAGRMARGQDECCRRPRRRAPTLAEGHTVHARACRSARRWWRCPNVVGQAAGEAAAAALDQAQGSASATSTRPNDEDVASGHGDLGRRRPVDAVGAGPQGLDRRPGGVGRARAPDRARPVWSARRPTPSASSWPPCSSGWPTTDAVQRPAGRAACCRRITADRRVGAPRHGDPRHGVEGPPADPDPERRRPCRCRGGTALAGAGFRACRRRGLAARTGARHRSAGRRAAPAGHPGAALHPASAEPSGATIGDEVGASLTLPEPPT